MKTSTSDTYRTTNISLTRYVWHTAGRVEFILRVTGNYLCAADLHELKILIDEALEAR